MESSAKVRIFQQSSCGVVVEPVYFYTPYKKEEGCINYQWGREEKLNDRKVFYVYKIKYMLKINKNSSRLTGVFIYNAAFITFL